MRKRNIYKDIVWLLAFCAFAWNVAGRVRAYCGERTVYSCQIQADADLTETVVAQMRKLAGILRFEPLETVPVTLRLESYVLETEITGADLDSHPPRFKEAPDSIALCNTPQLFFGKEMFSLFADANGRSPGKSQIEKWLAHYRELELFVTDADGRERKAGICGILEEPEGMVCMERGQMKEIFGKRARVSGGILTMRGRGNMEKARNALEGAGFAVRE